MPIHQAVRPVDGGFDVLPGRSGSGQLGLIGAPLFAHLLTGLAALTERYDLTLLDLPAGIDRAVRRLLRAATTRLVVDHRRADRADRCLRADQAQPEGRQRRGGWSW